MMLKWGPEFLQIRYRNLPPPLTSRLVFGFALQFQDATRELSVIRDRGKALQAALLWCLQRNCFAAIWCL